MTDLAALAREQYATLDPLAVRIRTHRLHTARPDDIEANVSRAVRLTSSSSTPPSQSLRTRSPA